MKCFSALVFLSFVGMAAAIPSAKQEKKPPLILRSEQRRWLADDLKAYHRQMRKVHKDYIPSYPDALSLTNLTIGTPPVDYVVSLESGTESTFMLGKDYPGRSAEQFFYDPALSSTSKAAGNYTGFTGDIAVYGTAYVDVITLYGLLAYKHKPQRFGVVNDVSDPYALEPTMPDGVLGLSWNPEDAANPNENSSFVINLFAKVGGPRYWCEWMNIRFHQSSGRRYYSSFVEFGRCPAECSATPQNSVPLVWIDETRSLAFLVDAFTYDGEQHSGGFGKVDTGVPNILLLLNAFLAIYYDVQPDYDFEHGLYSVDCSRAGTLPDWVFTVGGKEYAIPSTAYVVDLQLPDGQCALSAYISDAETTDYVFGYVFHNLWCIKMDVDNQAITFMEVLQE